MEKAFFVFYIWKAFDRCVPCMYNLLIQRMSNMRLVLYQMDLALVFDVLSCPGVVFL